MRTKPITYNDGRLAEPIGISAGIAHRIGARLLHEVREALPPTIFFFVGFNFIVLTTNLLVAQYLVAVSNFMLATVAALVVGKAVLVANKIPLLRRYDRAPLIQPILFKTAFYWVVVFLARLLEDRATERRPAPQRSRPSRSPISRPVVRDNRAR